MGNQQNLAKDLAKFGKFLKSAKKRAETEGGGYGVELPDGRYKAKLFECNIVRAKSSRRWQIDYAFEILSGDYAGEKIHKYQSIESEDDQVWVQRDLKRFGVEAPESIEDLIGIIKIIDEAKPEVKISLATKESGQFTYLDRVLDEIDFGDMASEESEAGEDEDGDDDEDDESEDVEDEDEGEESEDESDDEDEEESEDEDEEESDDEESEEDSEDDDSDDEDESEDSEDEDSEEIEIGMTVGFESKSGKTLKGKVTKILEEEEKVKVSVGDKVFTIEAEKLFIPEEPKAAKKEETKAAKKAAPAPKKKEAAKKAAPAPKKKEAAKKPALKNKKKK